MIFEIVPYGEYIAKVQVRYAAGAAPDVFLTWAQYKSMFVEDGMLLDLTDRINKSSIVRLDRFFRLSGRTYPIKGAIGALPGDSTRPCGSSIWICWTRPEWLFRDMTGQWTTCAPLHAKWLVPKSRFSVRRILCPGLMPFNGWRTGPAIGG